MGRYNSSTYRVRPVFDTLRDRDKTGRTWLAPLLGLPHRPDRSPLAVSPDQIGGLEAASWSSLAPAERGWSPNERRLPAPQGLLLYLIMHTPEPKPKHDWGDGEAGMKRRLLYACDRATQQEARDLLSGINLGAPGRRPWEILEGPSCPDVYLETPAAIIVIEGKFTEAVPTTDTKWMRVRSQMLRHIDAAWDQRDGRDVYGFFIVESTTAPGWVHACEETVAPDVVSGSLPHRNAAERATIADAFLGMTTWAEICRALAVDTSLLKSREQIDAQRMSASVPKEIAL